jgi:nitroreductase
LLPEEVKEEAVDLFEAITNRRSVRQYKADPVDERTVEKVLDAARWAPSWANSQCWRFVVVRDSGVKERLANTLFGISDRPNRTAEAMKKAPVAVAVCAELGKSGFRYGEPKGPATDKGDYWYMFDAALAMQNMVLAAHSAGLGTVIVGAFDAKMAAEVLKVPEGMVVVALTPLGYPDEKPSVRPRKELSEIVRHETFAGA